jgi:hypothetical protein
MDPLIHHFNNCSQESLDADEQHIKHQLLDKAAAFGQFTTAFVGLLWTEAVLNTNEHAARLFRLAEFYEPKRLDAACRRALFYRKTDYLTVERILHQNLDSLPLNPYADVNGQLTLWKINLLE